MAVNNALYEVFEYSVQDIFNSEQQITAALPKMIKAAQDSDLRQALSEHLTETQEHVRRIQQACQILGFGTGNVTCQGTAGLIREAEEQMQEFGSGPGGDAAIIACAQKVEHYEICGYGSVIQWAKDMDLNGDAIDLLKETIEEESEANERLTKIAKKQVNKAAIEMHPVGVSAASVY